MDFETKYNLIVDGLDEIAGDEELKEILKERNLKLYWGTATTGKPHFGYLKPFVKIAQFLKAGCQVTILLADLHAFLDSMKSTWDQLKFRTQYYELLIKSVLEDLGIDLNNSNLKFVKGSDYQLSEKYNMDKYIMTSKLTLRDANKAGAEVVKQSNNPKMSSLLYPALQALDEEYLGVDAQFGGVDQRKIFMFARQYLPKLGYNKRIHLMSPMIPSLSYDGSLDTDNKDKMSSSDPNSKIELLDTPKQIRKKIGKAFCREGEHRCGLMELIKHVLFPIIKLKTDTTLFTINRPEQYGGNITYDSYSSLEKAFIENSLSAMDLKQGVAEFFINLLENTRKKLNNTEFQEITKKAY